jgi:serine/threonine protein kinase/Tfp pilus assembly protein PilF
MNGDSNQEVVIFSRALELPEDQRAAYLAEACGGDEALRWRVEALLRAYVEAAGFMEEGPVTHEAIESIEPASGVPRGKSEFVIGESVGDRIDRYKLLQRIGEGGCGVVFLAEQEAPVHRQVALKVIKPGMDTKSVIARFEAERQALALMEHPNIAQVLDAGSTDSGRPYFVMELVRGIKITEYCDQNSLSTEDRLCLFIQVCQAVQHAHQKGIIHRDIKPSNILVSATGEGKPLPKIIDFGIAKATTGQQLTDKTLFTSFGMLIGTPAYMSPEQAALTTVEVDTRTDIYSLGVLLYELLTGKTPFDTHELLKAGFDEVRRVIRDQDPVRPSSRLTTMLTADLTSVSQIRQAQLPRLIREVRGDLDWIVMKALEKDPARRYATANDLALDVKRYLSDEPISARPPSKLYRFQKILLRNKLLFIGIGAIAALLIASLIVVSASLAGERQARQNSDSEKRKAQQVTRFLQEMLEGVGPSVALGRDTKMLREILDRTAKRVGNELTNQPAVEAELRSVIGRLYVEIGSYDQAVEMQRKALAIYRTLYGPESKEAVAALHNLGIAFMRGNKWTEAESTLREAVHIQRRLFGNENDDVAASLSDLAKLYTQLGRDTEAEPLAHESLVIRQKLFGKESLETSDSLRTLSIVLGDEAKWAEAESMAREVLAIRRKHLDPHDPSVATTLTDLAWVAGGNPAKLEEAESLEAEALAMRLTVLGEDHPDIGKALSLVGDRMRQRGQLNEAYTVLRAALSTQRDLLNRGSPIPYGTMHSLGETLEAQGKLEEAEAIYREVLAFWRKRGESDIPYARAELESLARVLMAQKKFADAERLLDQDLPPALPQQPSSVNLLFRRADLEARGSRWRKAAADALLAIELQPSNTSQYAMVATLLIKADDRPGYERFCKKIVADYGNTTNFFVADQVAKSCLLRPWSEVDLKISGRLADLAVTQGAGDKGAMPFFQVCKALSEYRQGHFSEAAEWAQKSINSTRVDARRPAYAVLAMADWNLGKKDAAREIFAKGESLVPRTLPARDAEGSADAWVHWLAARTLLDEAAALIESTPAAKADPGVR